MRPTTDPFRVTLVLEREGIPVTEFLYPDGATGTDETRAATFRSYTSATMLERERITRLTHEYAGGLRDYLDLESGCEQARVAVLRQVERGLWPGGRPSVEGDALAEQTRMIEAAWLVHASLEKAGYESMRGMLDRLIFLATWRVLVFQGPEEWRNIADRPGLDDGMFYAIWNAWLSATEATRRGK